MGQYSLINTIVLVLETLRWSVMTFASVPLRKKSGLAACAILFLSVLPAKGGEREFDIAWSRFVSVRISENGIPDYQNEEQLGVIRVLREAAPSSEDIDTIADYFLARLDNVSLRAISLHFLSFSPPTEDSIMVVSGVFDEFMEKKGKSSDFGMCAKIVGMFEMYRKLEMLPAETEETVLVRIKRWNKWVEKEMRNADETEDQNSIDHLLRWKRIVERYRELLPAQKELSRVRDGQ